MRGAAPSAAPELLFEAPGEARRAVSRVASLCFAFGRLRSFTPASGGDLDLDFDANAAWVSSYQSGRSKGPEMFSDHVELATHPTLQELCVLGQSPMLGLFSGQN